MAGLAGCAVVYDRLGEENGRTVCLVQLYELDDLELRDKISTAISPE
jgi:hypothetical protein